MKLKIMVRSAQVFKGPKMNLYAVVGGPSSSSSSPPQRITVDMRTAAPLWSPMEFEVGQLGFEETLVACIKCKRSVWMGFGKSVAVGSVELGLRALLDYYRGNSRGNMPVDIALPISSKSGKPRGVLYVAYMFVDPIEDYAPQYCAGARFAALMPSAPPIEEYARQYCAAAPVVAFVPSAPPMEEYAHQYDAVVPSAPYLPWTI